MTRQLLMREDIARFFGETVAWTYQHLNRIIRDEGFPPAMIGRGRAQRWDPDAIDAWKRSKRPAHLKDAEVTRQMSMDELDRRLDAHFGPDA